MKYWKNSVFTEEVKKNALSSNIDPKKNIIDSIKTCAYGTSKDLVCKNEKIKCNNIIKQCKK